MNYFVVFRSLSIYKNKKNVIVSIERYLIYNVTNFWWIFQNWFRKIKNINQNFKSYFIVFIYVYWLWYSIKLWSTYRDKLQWVYRIGQYQSQVIEQTPLGASGIGIMRESQRLRVQSYSRRLLLFAML